MDATNKTVHGYEVGYVSYHLQYMRYSHDTLRHTNGDTLVQSQCCLQS